MAAAKVRGAVDEAAEKLTPDEHREFLAEMIDDLQTRLDAAVGD